MSCLVRRRSCAHLLTQSIRYFHIKAIDTKARRERWEIKPSNLQHLAEDLHVEITAFAPPAEAHARIAYALTEVSSFRCDCISQHLPTLMVSEIASASPSLWACFDARWWKCKRVFSGEEVPHTGLERRDPAGADAGDGAHLNQRGRDRLSQTSHQPCSAHSPLFPWAGRFS